MTRAAGPLAALHYFATDQSLPVADFASAAAERGFDAVLLPEHTHIPVRTGSPYPGGADLPERYRRTLDPKRRAIVREHAGLMRALWQDTEAEF